MEVQPEVSTTNRQDRCGRWARSAVWLLVLPVLVGCQRAVVGNWHLAEAIPNRQVFCVDEASFRSDGTFSATTTIEGVTTQERGTYQFNGFMLKLRPQAGGQRAYPTTLKLGRLEIIDGSHKVILKKGKKGG